MNYAWWDRVVESVADRGREMLKLKSSARPLERMPELCDALLSSTGEASGVALAREVLRVFQAMNESERDAFFEMLHHRFGPGRAHIMAAAERYRDSGEEDVDAYLELSAAVESPRQELFRRLNQAAQGTAALVAMREDLLHRLKAKPHLRAVDADLEHLFGSWFNPGFLRLQRIDWETSASVLEKLISFEAVHAIQGWADLRRRLKADRRCFAFFHPALPTEPLIFVEVALVRGIATSAAPLLALDAPVLEPTTADTAIFYSINNCQYGLRGISFGNFLIKQVMSELSAELPGLRQFVTLSPMPRFADAVRNPTDERFTRERVQALLGEDAEALSLRAGEVDPVDALHALLDGDMDAHREVLSGPLERLALAYLVVPDKLGRIADPVARFHLSNGAQLERINPFADFSRHRREQSFGVMVNYHYRPADVERNHEQFMRAATVPMSRALLKTHRRVAEAWEVPLARV